MKALMCKPSPTLTIYSTVITPIGCVHSARVQEHSIHYVLGFVPLYFAVVYSAGAALDLPVLL